MFRYPTPYSIPSTPRSTSKTFGIDRGAPGFPGGQAPRPDLQPDSKWKPVNCSPGNEPILTTNGWVPIKDLDPARHKIASHDRSCNRMTWGGNNNPNTDGFGFEKSCQPYNGNLIVLETAITKTRVTPDHLVLAKLNEHFYERWCVYLMRRGRWWRIGVCVTARRPHRSAGVNGRLATEQADIGWILSVHDTKEEALIWEAVWQGRYGVPGLTFRSAKSRSLTERHLGTIHELTARDVSRRIPRLFAETGLQRDVPLYTRSTPGTRGIKKKTLRAIFPTAAGNLLPLDGGVDILVPKGPFTERDHRPEFIRPDPLGASIHVEEFEGHVFGLHVSPFHYYVSGGVVVGDSATPQEIRLGRMNRRQANAGRIKQSKLRPSVTIPLF